MDPKDAPGSTEHRSQNAFDGFEVLGRIHCTFSNLDSNVTSHPFVQGNEELLSLINQAEKNLADAYQLVSNLVN